MTIRTFAAEAGVTVKALLHYDKLGLLTPRRTPGGHRLYGPSERDRLRRLLALKELRIPLARMGPLLDADAASLRRMLGEDLLRLAGERSRLNAAIRALTLVEERLIAAPDDRGLHRLADVFDAPAAIDQMKGYFAADVWPWAKRFYDEWPTEPWIALTRDVAAAGADRSMPVVENFTRRYNELALAFWSDVPVADGVSRRLHEGFARAWRDREHWPEVMKRRFNDYGMNEVADLIAGG